jgi:hypothetical protein
VIESELNNTGIGINAVRGGHVPAILEGEHGTALAEKIAIVK